ncbi:hypothetical protein GCM10022223_13760 [Kineosporia mesophila]|uniref:Uncharacterized protein n=1 Tax=Kineosporia mesophila TaxID=566012 RepID=A0ABP6Z7T5_9ACTN|nr:hypothetical protein [Kineosporia mesophila]MCD5354790.1 hypothetical protein [Kineosporia mesophila]
MGSSGRRVRVMVAALAVAGVGAAVASVVTSAAVLIVRAGVEEAGRQQSPEPV